MLRFSLSRAGYLSSSPARFFRVWFDYADAALSSAKRKTGWYPKTYVKAVAMSRKPKKAYKASGDSVGGVRLLSGGNPQIAKADGDAPVQAYISAMPGWKSDVGRRLDSLIERTAPDVRKAVRWNSPWYGIEGEGWFLSYHVFTRYVKVTFLNGAELDPVPPGSGKDPDSRWVDIYEGELDESQMEDWVQQSAAIPGWKGFDTL